MAIITWAEDIPYASHLLVVSLTKNVWWRIWNSLYHYTKHLVQLYTIRRMHIPRQSKPFDQLPAGPTFGIFRKVLF